MINADAMFDGAAELGRSIAAKRAADRQTARDARNARRRARYAATPKPPKPAAAASHPDDTAWEQHCCCGSTPMPPCWYCESGGSEEPS